MARTRLSVGQTVDRFHKEGNLKPSLAPVGISENTIMRVGPGTPPSWAPGSLPAPALTHGVPLLSGGRVKTWKRRWFILTDNCLYYFEYTTVSEERVAGSPAVSDRGPK